MRELLEKRAKVFEQARELVLKAEKEARALTADEQAEYDKRMAEVKALGETIERSRTSADVEAELEKSIGPGRAASNNGKQKAGSDLADAAMDSFIRGGVAAMSDEQRSLGWVSPGASQARSEISLRAASPLSDVTGAAGAFTIPQGFYAQLEKNLKWYGGMRQASRIVKTATGNDLPWPNMDDTGNVGELVAENTAVSQAVTEMAFNRIVLKAYKYSSKLVLVPIELIQDAAFDVQAFVAEALGIRLGRIFNQHFTTGTGASQPKGVVTAATTGITGATGQTTTVKFDDLVNLVHKVDPAYRFSGSTAWMFHDLTAAAIELLKDNSGRPLINDTFTGISGPVEAGSTQARKSLLGYPVFINNDVAQMAANAKSILFGDFSKYIIRDVLDLMLVRFGEKYMDSAQIGFVAFSRADGNLQDAGAHPVQLYVNSAT